MLNPEVIERAKERGYNLMDEARGIFEKDGETFRWIGNLGFFEKVAVREEDLEHARDTLPRDVDKGGGLPAEEVPLGTAEHAPHAGESPEQRGGEHATHLPRDPTKVKGGVHEQHAVRKSAMVSTGRTAAATPEAETAFKRLPEDIPFTAEEMGKALEETRAHVPTPLTAVTKQTRGTESRIQEVLLSRRLDAIIASSKDGLGLGVLYWDLGKVIGLEPSAQLVDMIVNDMGNIETKVLKVFIEQIPELNEKGKTVKIWQCYTAEVEAHDRMTGRREVGSASEIINFEEMDAKGKAFARRLAIRKAARNAKVPLISTPKKAMVALVKDILTEYKARKREEG